MHLQSTTKLILEGNMKEKHVTLQASQIPILSNITSGVVTHSGTLIRIQAEPSRLVDTAY